MLKEVKPKILSKKVFYEDTYNIIHVESSLKLDKKLKESIQNNWQIFLDEAHKKGAKPWDGTYYRLENLNNFSEKTDKLYFSTIKYSEIRGITHNQDLSIIEVKHRPNHISTGSFIETKEGYFVFGLRNTKSVHKRAIDFIGGGLQPEEKEVNKGEDLFSNVKKEMEEEIGITETQINSITGIGVLLSSKFNVLFMFKTKLNITKDELIEVFKQRKDDEMDDLVFVKAEELEKYLEDKGSYRAIAYRLIEELI